MKILGLASTALRAGFSVREDCKTEEVETGVATFECRIGFSEGGREALERMCQVGNYLLRSADGENEFYTVIEAELDTRDREISLYAEDAGLDLLNEVVGDYTADQAHNAEWYVNKYIADSGFEIGINEIPTGTVRTLSWEGEQTVTERLASIATQFGGFEVSYSFAVRGLAVTGKYINLFRRRGKDLGAQLRLNLEIDRIVTRTSAANLATALLVTGGIPDGQETPITLRGYRYDDGDFYVDGDKLKSRAAVAKWSRFGWESRTGGGEGHIVRTYQYDTTSQQTLCAHAVTELKKLCEPEVNYEIEIHKLPENVRIGDTVRIVDDQGGLYLSARILKLETSVCDQKQTATLGEYLIRDSGISEKVDALAKQFSQLAQSRTLYTWIAYADDASGNGISLDPTGKGYLGTAANRLTEAVDLSDPSVFSWSQVEGESATVLRIDSSRGTVFKNSAVSTVLTVVIYHGGQRITDRAGLTAAFGAGAYLEWSWQRMDDETFGVISSGDSRMTNDGFAFTLSPDDVDTKVVFQCSLNV